MNYAIIVAGGTGTRMTGAVLPKQFIEIAGKPVIVHTIDAFLKADPEIKIIIPLPSKWAEHWQKIKAKYFLHNDIIIAEGGETRFHSVKNSLPFTSVGSIVAVHDAVRPVLKTAFIQRAIHVAETDKTAIPVIPVFDSLRKKVNEKTISVNRSEFMIIQTPQCFQQEILIKSYKQEYQESFTDDATVVEAAGYALSFFEGNKFNIKITTHDDITLAECILRNI